MSWIRKSVVIAPSRLSHHNANNKAEILRLLSVTYLSIEDLSVELLYSSSQSQNIYLAFDVYYQLK